MGSSEDEAEEKSIHSDLEDGEIEESSEDDAEVKLPESPEEDQSSHPRIVALNDGEPPPPPQHNHRDGVCKFFLRGNCTWGDACKFYHGSPGSSGSLRRSSSSIPRPNGPPVPLLSVQTAMPDEAWAKAVRESKDRIRRSAAKRANDEDFEVKQKYLAPSDEPPRKRQRDRSGSTPVSENDDDDKSRIPSLLDLNTSKPSAPPHHNQGRSRRGPQVSYGSHASTSVDHRRNHSRSRSPPSFRRGGPRHLTSANREPLSSSRFVPEAYRRENSRSGSRYRRSKSHSSTPPRRRPDASSRRRTPSPLRQRSRSPVVPRRYEVEERSSRGPKPRRSQSHSRSASPVGFRTRNPTRRQIEDFFAENDEDKPAAYRRTSNRTPSPPSDTQKRRREKSSSSTGSSSSSSTVRTNQGSSSSSASSRASSPTVSAAIRRRKTEPKNGDSVPPLPDAEAISSESDTPQRISSESEGEGNGDSASLRHSRRSPPLKAPPPPPPPDVLDVELEDIEVDAVSDLIV